MKKKILLKTAFVCLLALLSVNIKSREVHCKARINLILTKTTSDNYHETELRSATPPYYPFCMFI